MNQPPWLEHAWRELGEKERAGNDDNTRILQFYRDVGQSTVAHDETPWCAAFLGACLERAATASTRSLLARSYLGWGEPLNEGRLGAVAVLDRGSDPTLGHVGFLIGETADDLILLGGNQSDAVSVATFARSRLLGLRWPAGATAAAPLDGKARPPDLFARALAHVLEMEGGYTEDPHDPGGPTNFGITLAEFASWTGTVLGAGNLADLKSALKRIAPETVREIYRERYWAAAGCAGLPPALALMQFDTAVNQGVGAAIRILQETIGATVDGEVGPETLAAVAAAPLDRMLGRYADIHRRRYRALSLFWRFGRGWLNRVDSTLAVATAILTGTLPITTASKGVPGMSDNTQAPAPVPETPADTKWWGQSVTIWGTIITGLATVLPALGPLIGIDITGDLVQQLGTGVATTVQAIAGLAGTVMTIYGRVRATQPLDVRVVKLKL